MQMTCKELVELVTDYFEGVLPEATRLRFDEHLATCEGCTHYFEQMRRTIQLVGTLTEDSIAPETKDNLLQIFRDWKNA